MARLWNRNYTRHPHGDTLCVHRGQARSLGAVNHLHCHLRQTEQSALKATRAYPIRHEIAHSNQRLKVRVPQSGSSLNFGLCRVS